VQAIVQGHHGSPDVLALRGADVPVIGYDGVLVRVRAARPHGTRGAATCVADHRRGGNHQHRGHHRLSGHRGRRGRCDFAHRCSGPASVSLRERLPELVGADALTAGFRRARLGRGRALRALDVRDEGVEVVAAHQRRQPLRHLRAAGMHLDRPWRSSRTT
jgi:hypothetical protein